MRALTLLLPIGSLLFGGLILHGQEEIESAREAMAERLPDVAATRLQDYLKANPKLAASERFDVILMLGEALVRSGEAEKALAELAKLPDRLVEQRNYWQGMALAHLQRRDEALAKFDAVGGESPLFPQARFNALELLVSNGDYSKAAEEIAKLQSEHAKYRLGQVALLKAQIHLAKGELDDARKSIASTESETKSESERLLLLGRIELAAQEPSKALTAFSKILEDPAPIPIKNLAQLGKCDALTELGQSKEALRALVNLLGSESVEPLLTILPARFEILFNKSEDQKSFAPPLDAFVQSKTLGEDSNYATAPKLLACYYLSRSLGGEQEKTLLQLMTELKPKPEMASRVHLRLGEIAWQNGDRERARTELTEAKTSAPDSPLAAVASDLLARLAIQEQTPETARELFAKAAEHPDTDFAENALLNEAVLQLSTTPNAPLSALASKLSSEESKVALALERALALARRQAPEARQALLDFLEKHPDHPRMAQARLALAGVLLGELQPDFELIEQQLATLPEPLSRELSREKFRISYRLGGITNSWEQAVKKGDEHLRNFPEAENDPYFLLRMAESSYRSENFDRASSLFSKVAALPDAGELTEVALYYCARANLEIPLPEFTEAGLDILDKLITRSGPLATEARLLKARELLNLGQADESLKVLADIPGDPGDQPEAALLSAKAYREQATNEPKRYEKAISLYQRLLDDPRTTYQRSNQIHYLLAQTYRESGQPDLAIEPCIRVVDRLNRAPDETEEEWNYYYRCGFEAIDILLEANRARAALILARKLAQTKGPGAEQAKVRAEQIQLDHLLWTD
ncbi:tetratricopeptide repeat protein [Roseibacillus persicicus]|uniref:tetratricopeptide repeat protein n=1 Tax=Roseibacillus persicicus TaxID=454148 RepID=UPI00280F4F49|nr:tetratricopeptide repeat protein [Roseibacillus persicicus]MDQ8189280.1 tetratricopeptide repeat protein [Roseibacillus persicicus]